MGCAHMCWCPQRPVVWAPRARAIIICGLYGLGAGYLFHKITITDSDGT